MNRRIIEFNAKSNEIAHRTILTDNKIYMQHMINNKLKVDIIFADILYNSAQHDNSYSFKDSMSTLDYESFMRERFELAHKLMKSSSVLVVFVSQESLFAIGSILDSIFNKRNRISLITWNKASSNLRSRHIRNVAEYILIYAKNKDKVEAFATVKNNKFDDSMFTVDDKNQKFRWRNILAPKNSFKKEYCYPYAFQDGTVVYPLSKKNYISAKESTDKECIQKGLRSWRYSKNRLYKEEIKGNLKYEDGNIFMKEFVKSEMKTTNILQYKKMTYSASAYYINEILKDSDYHFTYAKPIALYNYIFTLLNLTKPECDDKMIIDVFAGSGITLNSILQINNKFNKNHHVTLLEIDKDIYETQLYILEKIVKGYETINRLGNKKIVNGLKGKIECIKFQKE